MKYKSKQSYGGWIGLLLGLVVFGFIIWGINYSLTDADRTLKILLDAPTYLFLVIYVYLLLGAFNLKYKVETDALVIIWGLQSKRIPWDQFDEIIDVKGRANLLPFLAVSWWGYMFGLYSAQGLGSVRMYATHTKEGFLFLKTKLGLFGLTPEDHTLMTAIMEKTGKEARVVDMDTMSSEEKGECIHEDRFFNMYYKLNVIFLIIFTLYLGICFPGSGAPKFIVLLLVLDLALFLFNTSNAKRLYQFSSQGAYITLLIGLVVTGIFIILSVSQVSFR